MSSLDQELQACRILVVDMTISGQYCSHRLFGMTTVDATDRRILKALDEDPRATVQWIAQRLDLARGTVHARLDRLSDVSTLRLNSLRLNHQALGYPLRAIVTADADQDELDLMIADLQTIPEVIECLAIAGESDLFIEIVAKDANDIYVITQRIMRCRGIRRTATSMVLRELIARRYDQLLAPEPTARTTHR
jgi:DNA-binding Lrp family transcriptional regulator